jgi:hypothetical protein
MAYKNQQFFGRLTAETITNENIIIGTGNFASGSNLISDFSISAGDENLIRVSQSVYSVGGAIPTSAYVTSIDGSIINLSEPATSTIAGDTFGLSTPSGSYLFTSASLLDPNNAVSVNDISGSDSGSRYAVLAVAKRNNSTAKGVFHIYRIKEVVHRDIATAKISFFAEWGEEGTELESGDVLQTAERTVAIIELTETGSISPQFSKEIAGMESLIAGTEYAGFNVALNQYFANLSGSTGTLTTGSFTGSFTGSNFSTDFTFEGDTLNVLGDVFVQGTLDAATKNFKIDHPTMEGYYLVHSSLEGPERGMYFRGKLQNDNIINLPDYWGKLVEVDDITVQLTPIENACQHYIKSITKEKIEVGCACGEPNCHYTVFAQRYDQGKFEILEKK